MVEAALRHGTAGRECAFEVFARHLPPSRRYGVVAGTGRLLELIDQFRFDTDDLEWLAANSVVDSATLDWLADYRFRGSIRGYREGEIYFPGSPILEVRAPFAQGVLLETLILSVLNYDSAVASAASRMVSAAQGRPVAEMGSRRANEHAAVTAARAAFIAGFGATSNLEAGRHWGIPTMGTAAHAFTLLHDSEEDAFRAQIDALGPGTTLLVDTFDVEAAVRKAVEVAGPSLGAVRLDSGDLPALVRDVRALLDSLGARQTKITVTNDLDEYAIAALSASPVDSYGVGTALVTGSGTPASGMVYKLVAHRGADGEWVPVAKRSVGKSGRAGRKDAVRRVGPDGVASAEIVTPLGSAVPRAEGSADRPLITQLATDGVADPDYIGSEGTARARRHHARAIAELPAAGFRLSRGEPALPTIG